MSPAWGLYWPAGLPQPGPVFARRSEEDRDILTKIILASLASQLGPVATRRSDAVSWNRPSGPLPDEPPPLQGIMGRPCSGNPLGLNGLVKRAPEWQASSPAGDHGPPMNVG